MSNTGEGFDLYEFLTGRRKNTNPKSTQESERKRERNQWEDEERNTMRSAKAESSRRSPTVTKEYDDSRGRDDMENQYIWVEVASNSRDINGTKGWKCDMTHIVKLIRPEILKAIDESKAEEETYRMKLLMANLENMRSTQKLEERKLELLQLQLKISESVLQMEMQKLDLESKNLEVTEDKKGSKMRFWKKH